MRNGRRQSGLPAVTVVVLNWNRCSELERCLRSLIAQSSQALAEVMVVDNASTDGSVEMVSTTFPLVRLVRSPTNVGFAAGNNLGFREARGEVILFLNNDTEVAPGCIDALAETFAANPDVALAGCVVKDLRDQQTFQEAGLSIDRTGFPIPFPRSRPELPPFYVSGCALAVRRTAAERLGLFDERYFLFAEDLDLCWRYQLAGFHLEVVPSAVVYHEGGASIVGGVSRKAVPYVTSLRRIYLRERNTLATILKNCEGRRLLAILPLYLAQLGAEFLLCLATLRVSVARQHLKAIGWNVANLPTTIRLRRDVQARRSVPDARLPFDSRWGKLLALRRVGIPRVVR